MSSEHLFSAVLTFSVLAAGTAAVGSEMVAPRQVAAPAATVASLPPVTVIGKRAAAVASLPAVTVVGKRIAAADAVTLPMVVVTGRRDHATQVAIDDTTAGTRVQ